MQRDYFNRLETDTHTFLAVHMHALIAMLYCVFSHVFFTRAFWQVILNFKLYGVILFIVALKKGTARNLYTIPLF